MRHLSRLAWLGIAVIALGTAMVIASLAVPGAFGALLRGYGVMLFPAAAWLFGGLYVRGVLARRKTQQRTPARVVSSPGDGSLRV